MFVKEEKKNRAFWLFMGLGFAIHIPLVYGVLYIDSELLDNVIHTYVDGSGDTGMTVFKNGMVLLMLFINFFVWRFVCIKLGWWEKSKRKENIKGGE